MKETPILFTPELAQLVHEGKKTVTRRPVRFSKDKLVHGDYVRRFGILLGSGFKVSFDAGYSLWSLAGFKKTIDVPFVYAPYSKGDLLWVREKWCKAYDGAGTSCMYAGQGRWERTAKPIKWRPSIHMPQWACRTWLKVLKVSVERVQEITHEDAEKEGVDAWIERQEGKAFKLRDMPLSEKQLAFSYMWNAVYPGSWDRNDWVWRIEFERTEREK